jgi:predicted dehydrogenase
MFILAGGTLASYNAHAAPSNRIELGVIGAGSRGTFVMGVFQKSPEVRVSAICDVFEPNLENALSNAAKAGSTAKAYRNYKALLDDKSINAVLIATPEHWHAQMITDALAAGKDVYVEKPLCQTPEQGEALVKLEAGSKSIVQVGMQRRSYDLYLEARKVVASGTLGPVHMVRSWWLNTALETAKATELKGKLDWDQWQGPAERRPFDPDRFRHWRQYQSYSGGLVADQGAHVYDGIHLLMNASYPTAVTATGNKPHVPGADTPESVVVVAEYPQDFLGIFTLNYAAMRYQSRNDQLNQFDGAKARLDIARNEYKVFAQGSEEVPVLQMTSPRGFGYATDLHVLNFLECVKTRQRPTAPMSVAFPAALVVQLANQSMRQQKRIAAPVQGR